jgi:hypothetical protein
MWPTVIKVLLTFWVSLLQFQSWLSTVVFLYIIYYYTTLVLSLIFFFLFTDGKRSRGHLSPSKSPSPMLKRLREDSVCSQCLLLLHSRLVPVEDVGLLHGPVLPHSASDVDRSQTTSMGKHVRKLQWGLNSAPSDICDSSSQHLLSLYSSSSHLPSSPNPLNTRTCQPPSSDDRNAGSALSCLSALERGNQSEYERGGFGEEELMLLRQYGSYGNR